MPQILPRLLHYHRPASIEEAKELLRGGTSTIMVLGGGVSLGMIARPFVREVVSLERLNLDWLRRDGQTLSLGSTLTLGRLAAELDARSPLERLLGSTITRTATTPLRNLMTVGGVIAGAGPWSDLPVSLLAAGAEVVLDGSCVVALEDVLARGPRRLAGSILTEVRVPTTGLVGASFVKFGRNETDLAIASAAVAIVGSGGTGSVRVAVGGLVPYPVRVAAVEGVALEGHPSRERLRATLAESLGLRPDPRADDEYRYALAATCIADCLEAARREATQ